MNIPDDIHQLATRKHSRGQPTGYSVVMDTKSLGYNPYGQVCVSSDGAVIHVTMIIQCLLCVNSNGEFSRNRFTPLLLFSQDSCLYRNKFRSLRGEGRGLKLAIIPKNRTGSEWTHKIYYVKYSSKLLIILVVS